MTAQRRGVDRVNDPLGVPAIVFDLFAARYDEHGRGQRQRIAMVLTIRGDRVEKRGMCMFDAAIDHDHDLRRQFVFVIRARGAGVSPAGDDIAQQSIRRCEDTGREVDRIPNRNKKFLLDDIHHQVTENNLASDPATNPVARMIAAYSGPAYAAPIVESSSTSESTPAFTARRIT